MKLNNGKDQEFPTNPFPDVNPRDFNKLNKKRVTEDFVSENFELMGWKVFEPYTDTGIDRIITKMVCPNGHTPLHSFEKRMCSKCGKKAINITRFLQIKTRSLRNGIFGFTIRPKDIRVDPRHTYVLYCDTTQDFFMVPVFNFLEFFEKSNIDPFSAPSFRKGNQKLNSLRYDQSSKSWWWGKHTWENFRNTNGLKILQNPNIDLNLKYWIEETRKLSNKLLMRFSSGNTYPSEIEKQINEAINTRIRTFADKQLAMEQKQKEMRYLKDKLNSALLNSIMKYWRDMTNINITSGENEEKEAE